VGTLQGRREGRVDGGSWGKRVSRPVKKRQKTKKRKPLLLSGYNPLGQRGTTKFWKVKEEKKKIRRL